MFSYILYGLAVLGLVISFFADRVKTKAALKKAWKSFEYILPQLLSILIIISLALSLLSSETIQNLIGSRSGYGVRLRPPSSDR